VARPAYFATIAARARGAVPGLVPPSVPMRGWDGAWPAELPPAAVVRPATPDRPQLAAPPAEARSAVPVAPSPVRADRAVGAAAIADHGRAAVALRARGVAPLAPDVADLADRNAAPRSFAPDPAVAHLEDPARSPRVAVAASPSPIAAPRADRPAAVSVERVAIPVAGSGGLTQPLRVASPGARVDRPADPAAGRPADRPSDRPAASGPRLTPAAALHTALQWVTASASERATSAAPSAVPPSVERAVAGPRAPMSRRDALPTEPAPRTLHIGSIEVEIQPPPVGIERDLRPAPAAPAGSLARGFATPLGLRQG
jgi:hypothetical protein